MFGIGFPELIVIMALALIVLGPEQLPTVAKQIAKFVNELRKAGEEFKKQLDLEDIKNLRDKPAEWEKEIKDVTKKGNLFGGVGDEWKEASKEKINESSSEKEEETKGNAV